jgi:outer membrane protein assembly factor BamA
MRPTDSAGAGTGDAGAGAGAGAGVGAGALSDSLGGDARFNLLATLSVPVPVPQLATMRAFVFANAGAISNLNSGLMNSGIYSGLVPTFPSQLRASVGGGFSASFADSIRMECTYAIPVLKAPQDQLKSFQLGVGVTIN